MASTLNSTTTQNVAAGGAASGGLAYAILAALRSVAPDLLPWPPDTDIAIALALTAILTPLVSRVIAFRRHPEKALASADTSGLVVDFAKPNPPKPEVLVKELSDADKAKLREYLITEWQATAPTQPIAKQGK